MLSRYAGLAAVIVGIVLIAHAVLAFTKLRWVTALLELIAAAVLLWNWWQGRRAGALPPGAPPR